MKNWQRYRFNPRVDSHLALGAPNGFYWACKKWTGNEGSLLGEVNLRITTKSRNLRLENTYVRRSRLSACLSVLHFKNSEASSTERAISESNKKKKKRLAACDYFITCSFSCLLSKNSCTSNLFFSNVFNGSSFRLMHSSQIETLSFSFLIFFFFIYSYFFSFNINKRLSPFKNKLQYTVIKKTSYLRLLHISVQMKGITQFVVLVAR